MDFQGLLNELRPFILLSLFSCFILLFCWGIQSQRDSERAVWENKRNRFYDGLRHGIRKGAITSSDDVKLLFEGIVSDEASTDILIRWLKSFIANEFVSGSHDMRLLRWKKNGNRFLKELSISSPYSALPKEERGIMLDLESYFKVQDGENFQRKLEELKSVILLREDKFEQLEITHKKNSRSTNIGIALSIIFGLFGVISYFV